MSLHFLSSYSRTEQILHQTVSSLLPVQFFTNTTKTAAYAAVAANKFSGALEEKIAITRAKTTIESPTIIRVFRGAVVEAISKSGMTIGFDGSAGQDQFIVHPAVRNEIQQTEILLQEERDGQDKIPRTFLLHVLEKVEEQMIVIKTSNEEGNIDGVSRATSHALIRGFISAGLMKGPGHVR